MHFIPYLNSESRFSLLYTDKLPPASVDHQHNETIRDAYTKFLGIPRLCFYAFSQVAMKTYLEKVQQAVNNIHSIDEFTHSTSGHRQRQPQACMDRTGG
jgi:hypothetical protein